MKIPTFLTTTAFKVTSGVVLTSSLVGGGVFIANNQTRVQSDTAVERGEFNSFVAQQNQVDNTQNQRIDSIVSSSSTSSSQSSSMSDVSSSSASQITTTPTTNQVVTNPVENTQPTSSLSSSVSTAPSSQASSSQSYIYQNDTEFMRAYNIIKSKVTSLVGVTKISDNQIIVRFTGKITDVAFQYNISTQTWVYGQEYSTQQFIDEVLSREIY